MPWPCYSTVMCCIIVKQVTWLPQHNRSIHPNEVSLNESESFPALKRQFCSWPRPLTILWRRKREYEKRLEERGNKLFPFKDQRRNKGVTGFGGWSGETGVLSGQCFHILFVLTRLFCCSVFLRFWGTRTGDWKEFWFCCLLFCLPKVLWLSIHVSFQQSTATARYEAGNR